MIKITFSNKKITSLNRKGKLHTRQSFQPSYIIEFSLLKKMGITRWNQMPIVPFSILATSQIIPPRLVSWSHQQGTTRAGSTEVTTILHLDGWHDKESVPASILKVLSMLITSKRKWNFCRIKVDSSIILNKWFSSCWSLTSMSRSK